MKKLILTAAFTLAGVIAVSAQTEITTQNSNSQTNQSATQNQQNAQATSNWGTASGTANQTQNTGTTTVEATPATTVPGEATVQINSDTAVDKTRSTDALKEEKKSKKKKSK